MLTDAAIRRAVNAGKTATLIDHGRRGDGRLIVMVRPMPSGALAEFYARQISDGKRRLAKLGTFPSTTLSQAREAFRALSPAIREGENLRVSVAKRTEARKGLATVAELFAAYADSLGSRRCAPEVRRVLLDTKGAAAKVFGPDKPAKDITPNDVAEWLRPIHRRAPVAANQSRAWVSAAYSWAMKRENDYTIDQPHRFGLVSNPAAMVPTDTVARRTGTRFLSPEEFSRVWHWLASEGGRSDQRACNALRLMMATGQRVEEIVFLRAGQYSDGWLRWDKTKTGNGHAIPLPKQARSIIESIAPNRHGLYFPGCKRPGEPYRTTSMIWIAHRCASQLGIPRFCPRDFRRTWRTLAGDIAGLNAEECARVMNHAYGSAVESRHYNKGSDSVIKTEAMRKWEIALESLIKKRPD